MKKWTMAYNLQLELLLLFAICLCSKLVWCQKPLGSGDKTWASPLPTVTPSVPLPNPFDSSDTNSNTTNPKATSPTPKPDDSLDDVHTNSSSETATIQCYKKAYGLKARVTTCTAGPHGCYETERRRSDIGRDLKMGCLKSPCKPLRRGFKVVRQCCDTSLCNDLHNRQSLFLPPPQTLPPLNSSLLESGGIIYCYSPTHHDELCISVYGCYTLKDYRNNTVLNRTCIERPDFEFCVEPVVIGWVYAECCYDDHHCNAADLPRKRRDIRYMGNTTDLPSTGVTTKETSQVSNNQNQWSFACLLLSIIAMAIILCMILAFLGRSSGTRTKAYSCESVTL